MQSRQAQLKGSIDRLRFNSWQADNGLSLSTMTWFVLCGMCLVAAFVCWMPGSINYHIWAFKGILFALGACLSYVCGSLTWPDESSHIAYLPASFVKGNNQSIDWWSVNSTLNVAALLVLTGVLVALSLITATLWGSYGVAFIGYSAIAYLCAALSLGLAGGVWQIMQVVEAAEKALSKAATMNNALANTVALSPKSPQESRPFAANTVPFTVPAEKSQSSSPTSFV